MKLWMRRDKPIGSIDYMRAELVSKYGGERFWVTSFDSKKIDCMFIKARVTRTSLVGDPHQQPTIIFCNPNACYYECLPV
jgi:hypothetical protein